MRLHGGAVDTVISTTGLDALIAECPQAARLAIHEANTEIAAIARQLVRVDTGQTRDSIHVEDEALSGEIGGEVVAGGAALWLELGWHTASGRAVGPFPFLRPAFDAVMPSLPAKLANYLFILGQGGVAVMRAALPALLLVLAALLLAWALWAPAPVLPPGAIPLYPYHYAATPTPARGR